MKRLFRSLIDIKKDGKSTIPPDELVRNYKVFKSSTVKPEDPSFLDLFTWIEAHFRTYKEMPAIDLLYEKAQAKGDATMMAALKDILEETPYIRSNYQAIVKEKFDTQVKEDFRTVLTRTWEIVTSGFQDKENKRSKKLLGMDDALEFIASQTRKFRFQTTGIKTESLIQSKEDAQEVKNNYDKKKKDPLTNIGMYTFLDKIDESSRGVKLGELCLIAAYVAQGKSTFVANMAYSGIMQGMNGLFIPLEMTFEEMRDLMYVLHASWPNWKENPKYKHLAGKLSYKKARYAEYNKEEEDFFNVVREDFSTREEFGRLKIVQPTGPLTPASLELYALDYQAELAEKGKNLDFLIVDYVGLMNPDKDDRYGEYNIDLNNIIRKLKIFSLTFNNGRGLRTISPFQVNRDGWKEAVKNDGVYKLTALSSANEADRSSDLVISLYMTDEMKRSGMIKISCMKKRRDEDFVPFDASIDWTSMRISDPIMTKSESSDAMAVMDVSMNEIALDAGAA